jgi:hypothetical protein
METFPASHAKETWVLAAVGAVRDSALLHPSVAL